MFYSLKMRGLNNKNHFLLIIFVSLSTCALGQLASNAPSGTSSQNEPFNIGQQIIVEQRRLTLQQQLFYFQFERGSLTLSRMRGAYGFTDSIGFELSVPYILSFNRFGNRSAGFGDIRILTQWNYFRTQDNLATFITGLEAPTGSINKQPPTGFGSVTYIAEFGFIHSSQDWYADYFIRGFKRRSKNNIDPGSEVRFRTSLGPKIHFGQKVKSDLFALVQLRSIYENKTKINDIKDSNTGGFVALLGPLFSYRRSNGLVEGTLEFPISERLNDRQDPLQWSSSLTFQIEF